MVWKSKISTDEANDLIKLMSENVRLGIEGRDIIESQLFPVSAYIGIACRQLYEQSYQFKNLKLAVENGLEPKDITLTKIFKLAVIKNPALLIDVAKVFVGL